MVEEIGVKRGFIVLLCLLFLFFSCAHKREPGSPTTTKRLTGWQVLSKRRLGTHENLVLALQWHGEGRWEHVIDSVAVRLNDTIQEVFESVDTISFALSPAGVPPPPLGRQQVQVHVHMKGGKRERHILACTLLADMPPERYRYTVEGIFPHDPDAYTQGLFYHAGYLYESTGQKGSSFLRQVDIASAKVLREARLSPDVFGEGIARHGERVYQLTWEARKGYIYRLEDLHRLDSFHYETEGWGLTLWKGQLVMSDGSEYLRFYDPEGMEKVREVQVYDHEDKVEDINELETVGNTIYANIYHTQLIKVIIPETGRVLATIDLADIYDFSYYQRRRDVMNGIAYQEDTGHLYVTGKWWPKLFKIRVEGPQ